MADRIKNTDQHFNDSPDNHGRGCFNTLLILILAFICLIVHLLRI